MVEEIHIKYINPALNIGMEDIRNVWLLSTTPVKLTTTLHQGNLIFRIPVSGKRISYKTLKRGLVKKKFFTRMSYELLPDFKILQTSFRRNLQHPVNRFLSSQS